MPKRKSDLDEAKQQAVEEIAGLVDALCLEHLGEEYAALCRRLTEKLARKRPSLSTAFRSNAQTHGMTERKKAVGSAARGATRNR
jgi:hypothetical protein